MALVEMLGVFLYNLHLEPDRWSDVPRALSGPRKLPVDGSAGGARQAGSGPPGLTAERLRARRGVVMDGYPVGDRLLP